MFGPGSPATRLEWDEVLKFAPEKLFIDLCSSNLRRQRSEVEWLASQDGWWGLPAVRGGEVYLIDHAYFSVPGPRIVTGLEILAQLTHPEIFEGLIPPDTVLKLEVGVAPDSLLQGMGDRFVPWPSP